MTYAISHFVRARRLVTTTGAEFARRALEAWAYAHGVELRFIRPGKPIENAYVESFKGKFRDECLNEHWFVSLADAKAIIEAGRIDLQHRAAAWLARTADAGSLRRLRRTSTQNRTDSQYPRSGLRGRSVQL